MKTRLEVDVDLVEYEQTKFKLAAILRSAEGRLRSERPNIQAPFTDLFARLAEDRFNLVVIGRFSRGKSSLMNALLDSERLPIGIVPITSVITTVAYGSKERAVIKLQSSPMPIELTLDRLADYVTQQGNPGNQRRVALARIELPSELLRRGFHFVDTPGLGSAILANTQTTERYLPQADAFMLVTSFDSPLSEEELQCLARIAPSPTHVFLVINKSDLVSPAERTGVLAHVQEQARRVFGEHVPRMYSVSAREALEATRQQDGRRYAESGLQELRTDVTRFLLAHKQTDFLLRMCERIASAMRETPFSQEDSDRLRALQQAVFQSRPNARLPHSAADSGNTDTDDMPQFTSCHVCEQLDRELYDFLCRYQWDLTARHSTQLDLANHGGFCAFHYWQLGSIASPQTICVGLSPVIEHWAARLRDAATTLDRDRRQSEWHDLQPTPSTCDMCRVHISVERSAVGDLVRTLEQTMEPPKPPGVGLCLRHLEHVLRAIGSDGVAQRLLFKEAAALQRLSEDMRRYAVQRDGLRRELASEEDRSAELRALRVLGGHRNVFALRRLD